MTSLADEQTLDEAGRTVLTGISSRAFEHPADRAALTAMRAIPGFDQVIKLASGFLRERQYRLAFLASAVRVDERQFADLHRLFGEAVTVLDVPVRPELRRWARSDEYRQILDGDYPRREDDRTASLTETAKEAARAYRQRIEESSDPLVGAVRGFGNSLGNAADNFFDWLTRQARAADPRRQSPPSGDDEAPPEESSDDAEPGTPPDPDQL
jgi:hypothetical protein